MFRKIQPAEQLHCQLYVMAHKGYGVGQTGGATGAAPHQIGLGHRSSTQAALQIIGRKQKLPLIRMIGCTGCMYAIRGRHASRPALSLFLPNEVPGTDTTQHSHLKSGKRQLLLQS